MDQGHQNDASRRSVRLAGQREVPLGVNERRRQADSSISGAPQREYLEQPRAGRTPRSQRGTYRAAGPGAARNSNLGVPRSSSFGSTRNPNFGAARGSGLSGKRGRSHGYVDGSRRWSAFKSSRVTHPHLRSNRIFARATWIDRLLQPRVIVAVLALVLVGGGGLAIYSSAQQRAAEEAAQAEAAAEKKRLANQAVNPNKLGVGAYAVSTPRSEWTQGTMPHLYQTDPAWANKSYAGGTVRANACGPTSLTMVYIYLTGRTDLDPGAMAAFADENNFAPTGATEWSFMTEGASMLGIHQPLAPGHHQRLGKRASRHLQRQSGRLHHRGSLHRAAQHRRPRHGRGLRPQQPLQLRTTLGHPGDPQPNPSVLVILGVIPPPSRCVIQSAPFHKHTSAYGRTRLTMSLTRLPMAICRFRGPSG